MWAEEFGRIFLEANDVSQVMQSYGRFRENAVLNRGQYRELEKIFNRNGGNWYYQADSWKGVFLKYYSHIMELCGDIENRKSGDLKRLAEKILDLLWGIADDFSGLAAEWSDFRFAVLDVMLDAVCAYGEADNRLRYPAMIYDMICRLNRKDEGFCQFYGEKAEQRVVDRTLDIAELTDGKTAYSLSEEIEQTCRFFRDKSYILNFCGLLSEKQRTQHEKDDGFGVLQKDRSDIWQEKEKNRIGKKRKGKMWAYILLAFLTGFLLGLFSCKSIFRIQDGSVRETQPDRVTTAGYETVERKPSEGKTRRDGQSILEFWPEPTETAE